MAFLYILSYETTLDKSRCIGSIRQVYRILNCKLYHSILNPAHMDNKTCVTAQLMSMTSRHG